MAEREDRPIKKISKTGAVMVVGGGVAYANPPGYLSQAQPFYPFLAKDFQSCGDQGFFEISVMIGG